MAGVRAMSDVRGVSVVSDGTSDGTVVTLDGKPISGVTHVSWAVDKRRKRVKMILEIDGVAVRLDQQPDEVARGTLARVI